VQHAAGELVDDQDLAVADDVVLVLVVELLGLQRVVEVPDQRRVGRLVQVVDAQLVLDERDTGLEHADSALADVHLVVDFRLHQRRHPGELLVPARRLVRGAGDDQRRARLVDQDRVDLVDDREEVRALHAVVQAPRHVVAQVVEAELVVRAVGDVGGVRLTTLVGRHVRDDHADIEAEEPVDPAHPLRVTLGQVVVDGHDVHAAPGERVEVRGQHTGQGLALTGLHLGDHAEVQRRAAHHLHVEVPLLEHTLRGLTGHGERVGQQVVQLLAVGVTLLELVRFGTQLGVGQVDDVLFEGVDVRRNVAQALEYLALARAKHPTQHHVAQTSLRDRLCARR
jgi:hypothetical protein